MKYKQSTIVKIFKNTFPDIRMVDGVLDEESLIEVFRRVDSTLNFDNPAIREWIFAFGFEVRAKKEYVAYQRAKVNPNGTVGGSRRLVSYWTIRGWSEDEAKQKISEIQSSVSKRCTSYWTSRGYSDEDAERLVSEHQIDQAKQMWKVIKANDTTHLMCYFDYRFHMMRGMSEEEAREFIAENSRKGARAYFDNVSIEDFRRNNHYCIEYHLSRGKTVEDYEEHMAKVMSTRATVSKSSIEFFDEFTKLIPSQKVYYGQREYGKYIKDYGFVKYDYTDLDNMFIVEYDGVYWHRGDEAKKHDQIKENHAKSLGFLIFRLTDIEHYKKIVTPESLAERIKCELSKR